MIIITRPVIYFFVLSRTYSGCTWLHIASGHRPAFVFALLYCSQTYRLRYIYISQQMHNLMKQNRRNENVNHGKCMNMGNE